MGGVVVEDHGDDIAGRPLSLDGVEEADVLLVPMALHVAVDRAVEDIQRGEQVAVPWRLYSWVMVPGRPFFRGRPGSVRSSAWIWLFP